tara:strand:- start:2081 stop:2296 length:216 start_codon:yes stop_codon:yes gene_type:complete
MRGLLPEVPSLGLLLPTSHHIKPGFQLDRAGNVEIVGGGLLNRLMDLAEILLGAGGKKTGANRRPSPTGMV